MCGLVSSVLLVVIEGRKQDDQVFCPIGNVMSV